MFHCTRTHAHAQARTGARSQAHARTGPLCPARSGSATTSTFPHHIAATDQPGRRPSRATFPDLVHAPRTYTHTNRYRLTHGVPLLAPSPVQFRIRGHPRCPHCGSASPVMTTMTSLTAVRSPHADCDSLEKRSSISLALYVYSVVLYALGRPGQGSGLAGSCGSRRMRRLSR